MPHFEALVNPLGSVLLGWLEPGVLYARFDGAISADLGARFAERFTALVADRVGVRLFNDSSSVATYDVRALTAVLDALRSKKASLQLIVARPWQDAVTERARGFIDGFECLEYVTGAAAFDARLRVVAPTGFQHVPRSHRPSAEASGAAFSGPTDNTTYVFDLSRFEQGSFTAVRWKQPSPPPSGAWVCVARDDEQALVLAQRAALDEWAQPRTRHPETFSVLFTDFANPSEAIRESSWPSAEAPAGLTPSLERIADENGSALCGWLCPQVYYSRLEGVISDDLGIRFALRFNAMIGDEVAIHYLNDSASITAFDVKAYAAVVDVLLAKRDQFKLIVTHTWQALGPRASALPQSFDCFEYVGADEFEARLRAAAPPAALQHLAALLEAGAKTETAPRVSSSDEPGPVPPSAAEPSSTATYAYVFDLRNFESGRFIATRFARGAVRPSGSWVCTARSDAEALALAIQASVADWPQPQTRLPGQFTVRFVSAAVEPTLEPRR